MTMMYPAPVRTVAGVTALPALVIQSAIVEAGS